MSQSPNHSLLPFEISIDQEILDDLGRRLASARLPVADTEGWEDGTDLGYLATLIDYWRDGFDWRVQERALNRFSQIRGELNGTTVHAIHEKGRGPAPMPIVLAHGWPDGFVRFARIIPLLTDPAAHGGDPADAFDVVAPSLPGYGFSRRGGRYGHASVFADMLHELMGALGYVRYGAHGGDIGAIVCERLALKHAGSTIGVHLTDVPALHTMNPPADTSPAEEAYLRKVAQFANRGGGYRHIQGTKPWTAAVGLNDSPAGLAAWIIEKFQGWSDCDGDIERRFSKDELLTNITLYWATETIGTSFLSYRDLTKAGMPESAPAIAPAPDAVPAGFALFPKDIATPPREWAERFFDVRRWSEMPAGGHFAALGEPAQLAEEIRAFFRPLR